MTGDLLIKSLLLTMASRDRTNRKTIAMTASPDESAIGRIASGQFAALPKPPMAMAPYPTSTKTAVPENSEIYSYIVVPDFSVAFFLRRNCCHDEYYLLPRSNARRPSNSAPPPRAGACMATSRAAQAFDDCDADHAVTRYELRKAFFI